MSHPDPQADQYIDSIESLPPAPRILRELLNLLQDPDSNADRITRLIADDPVLTARTLKLCNNALFRGDQPVHDLQGAVLRLGFNQLYQVVAGLVGKQTVSGAQPGYGIGQGALWKHSAATAVAGKVLAPEVGLDANLLFTAALLPTSANWRSIPRCTSATMKWSPPSSPPDGPSLRSSRNCWARTTPGLEDVCWSVGISPKISARASDSITIPPVREPTSVSPPAFSSRTCCRT